MVQSAGGGNLEQVQINLIINTIAQMQQLRLFTTELERLGERVQQRNPLGQFTKTTQEQFSELQRSGRDLSQTLQEGFGPRFISSTGQANSALIRIGSTFGVFSAKAQAAGQISSAQAANFQQLSGQITGIGVSGQASAATLQALVSRLSQISATSMVGRSAINALNAELMGLQQQIQRVGIERNLTQPLTGAAAAGQGLLLSFSISQAIAGRLSAALFGLGFALIFTKTGFLNLTTVAVALAASLGTLVLDKYAGSLFKSTSESERLADSLTKANERLEEFRNKLTAAQALADLGISDPLELLGERDVGDLGNKTLKEIRATITANVVEIREYNRGIIELARSGEDISLVFRKEAEELRELQAELNKSASFTDNFKTALKGVIGLKSPFKFEKPSTDVFEDFVSRIDGLMAEARIAYEDEVANITREFEQADQLKIKLKPIKIERQRLETTFDIQTDVIQREGERQANIVREVTEGQVDARRRALETETDIIRQSYDDQTDTIRQRLEDQLSALRDADDKRIDVIRDALNEEIELLRDQSEIRIDTISKNAEAEIDVNKDRISKIREQERELTKVLSDLRSKREEVRADIIGQEAMLAAIERDARASGVMALEEQTLIRARIEGLQAEDNALSNTIAGREQALNAIQNQINSIENLINKIEEARDQAIKAARDEAEARQKVVQNAADNEIKAIRDVANQRERDARRAADTQVEQVNRARDATIRAAQDSANADIKAIQQVGSARITAVRNSGQVIEGILRKQQDIQGVILDQQEEEIRRADRLAQAIDPIVRAYRELLKIRVVTSIILGIPLPSLPSTITDVPGTSFLPRLPSRQLGGIVPGPIGQPRLIKAHGGEEIRRPDQQNLLPAGSVSIIIENLNVNDPSDLDRFERVINNAIGRKTKLAIRSKKHMSR